MSPRALIGLVLLGVGALIWFVTPGGVTWGNHHYFKHLASWGLISAGALFLLVGSRR